MWSKRPGKWIPDDGGLLHPSDETITTRRDRAPLEAATQFVATERAAVPIAEHEFWDDVATKIAIDTSWDRAAPADTLRPEDELVGLTLDERYRIVRELGSGSMAVVYVAEQLSIKRKVAIKVLSPSNASNLVEIDRRFRAEAHIIARLTHPNTVRLFDYGRTPDGRPYFVTDLLGGRSLSDVLKDGALEPFDVLDIMRQVARSLEEAHALGIVHRDLKPANMFVDRLGEHLAVKILDFGVAKVAGNALGSRAVLTAEGMLLGTPAYMSPEQCLGEAVGAKSDLYSLGAIAYHALAGEPPFRGGVGEQLAQHVSASPMALARRVPGLDPRIESLVMGLLSKDPADRPPSAGALAARIDELERGGTSVAAPVVESSPKRKRRLGTLLFAATCLLVPAALIGAMNAPAPRVVPDGYVDAPVADAVHDAFSIAVDRGDYGAAIALLEEANRAEPHYDTVYNIVVAYDAWGGRCTEVMGVIDRFMKLCMGCSTAAIAAPRFGRIYERCGAPSGESE